jgi:hypothetical protein
MMLAMLSLHGLAADAPGTVTVPSGSPFDAAITGFLLQSPKPGSTEVANFLKAFKAADRTAVAQALIARGVSASAISSALGFLNTSGKTNSTIWGLLTVASAAASGYHGIKRNHGSIGWGIGWFLLGGIAPVLVPVVAVAQGFAKPK